MQSVNLKNIADSSKRNKIEDVLNSLVLKEDCLRRIMSTFEEQITYANSKDEESRKKSNLFWECTFVTDLLNGKESGEYLGLDLGSTNFRVLRVVFNNGRAETTTKYYNLPLELLSGPCSGVFDHIAESIEKFMTEENLKSSQTIPLGFSFSFPSIQKSLKHSILVTWTKSFKCPDGPGLDPAILLEEAIRRRGGLSVPVNVMARISDTTGTLMAGNYMDPNCRIGLILGTGSNACFVERVENYNKLETNIGSDKILVNCEWGALGDNGCLDFMKSEFDIDLDQHSNHVNSYSFEKLFSGYFLGELVRLVLVKLMASDCLFSGLDTNALRKAYSFTTAFVTSIEKDTSTSENTMMVLKHFNLNNPSEEDLLVVRETCAVMSHRGAAIVAAALAVLLNHINLPSVTIGIDGSLYEHHPKYHSHIMELLTKLVPTTQTKLILVKDGSGQGSAFVAAVETRNTAQ